MKAEEIRKKTGIVIDGWGNKKEDTNKIIDNNTDNLILNTKSDDSTVKKINTDYKDINSYKPTGNLIYNPEIINKIENKYST